jgi:2-iminobutanoate/2-iminopropanoate deaminase
MAKREVVRIPEMDAKLRALNVPLSMAVRWGDLLFVSGVAPVDFASGKAVKGDIAAQTRKVLDNLKLVLEAGGSSLGQVLKATVFSISAEHYAAINAVYAEYFPIDPPARTFVPCGPFAFKFDLEIECVAGVSAG